MRNGFWLGLAMMALVPAAHAQTPPATSPTVMVPNSPTTTQYDPAAGFPDHNGPFSAMLIVIPQSELDEFNGENGGARHLDRVSRAEPGALLALKFVFVGIQSDWNHNSAVTYDLTVLAPDGSLYAGSDYKNLDALHGPVGSGQGVFDNRGKVVLMQFDDKDAPGVYTIKATLHDTIAHRDIPLQTTVELVAKPVAAPATPPPTTAPAAPVAGGMQPIANPDDDDSAKPVKGKKRGHRRHRHH